MRIRKRPPPQIPSDPNAPKLEERSIPALSAQSHRHGDLLQGLHGWRRRPDPSPLNSHHQVLQEEKMEMIEVDSPKPCNSLVCSNKSSGAKVTHEVTRDVKPMCAKVPYEDTGDEKSMLKAKDTFNDSYENGVEVTSRKKQRSPTMEGSRCSRVNGRGWRCCQETMVGYALCEHHLGKGRLRSIRSMRGGNDQSKTVKGRQKIGMLKARSISSLISESNSSPEEAKEDSDVYNAVGANRDGCDSDDFNGATQLAPSIP